MSSPALATRNRLSEVRYEIRGELARRARELEMQGASTWDAAREACRLRLRPIVMTSIAFIAGAIPLLVGQGAGSEVRAATGVTVFSGMLGVTLFGLFLTPVFYVSLRKLSGTELRPHSATEPANAAVPPALAKEQPHG